METGISKSQPLVALVIELEWITSCFNNYPLPLHHQFMHSDVWRNNFSEMPINRRGYR